MDNIQALLDICILDHLRRKGLNQTADIFRREARVSEHITKIDGYLSDWWGVFAETYSSRLDARREEYPFPGDNVSSYLHDQQFVPKSSGHRTTLPADHHLVNSRQIIDQVAHGGQNNVPIVPFLPGLSRYQGVKPPFIKTTPREIPFTPSRDELPGLTNVIDGFPELPNILGGSSSREIPVISDVNFTSIRAPRLEPLTSFLNDFRCMPETRKVTPQEISSSNSGSSSHESQEVISPIVLPRGMPLTHFLDGFPEVPKTSEKQFERPKVPSKVLRQNSSKREITGQLGLKQKSDEGGDSTEG